MTLFDDTPAAESFGVFWSLYPRHVARAQAVKAWAKAVKTTSPDVIMAGLERARASWERNGTAPRFIPHASTWLNGSRWEDEDAPLSLGTTRSVDRWLAQRMAGGTP